MAKAIGTLGTIDTLTVGGRTFTDLTNLIILYGLVSTAGRHTTLRLPNASSGYQVTSGKTFKIEAIFASTSSASAGPVMPFYGDTDVGLDSASAPTNPVYIGGNNNPQAIALAGNTSGNLVLSNPIPGMNFSVPAGKYPCVYAGATSSLVAVYGYEV